MKTNLLLRFIAVCLFSIVAFGSVNAQNPMCMIGDAAKYGFDKDKSSPLTQDGVNLSKFYYKAYLKVGSFKFLKQNSDWVPSWNKGATETTVLKRNTYADPDVSFTNATAGNYAIILDTTALTLSVTPMAETTPILFNTVFMVGSAAPNGWDLGKATELVKNPTNPFEFTYTGALAVGDFKFPVNRNFGWNQDFFMKVSDNLMVLQNSPDVKWSITEAGNYKVTINTNTLAINIEKQIVASVANIDNSEIKLYPNPTTNCVNINLGKETKARISIYDMCGRNVYQNNVNEAITSINLSEKVRSQILFVKIETATYSKSYKLLVQ